MFYKILDESYGNLIGYLYTDAPLATIEETIRKMKEKYECTESDIVEALTSMAYEAYMMEPESIYF